LGPRVAPLDLSEKSSVKERTMRNSHKLLDIRFLESADELAAVEKLQQLVWPGDDIEIVPAHMLLAAVHGGGLLIGAFDGEKLVGFVFGFPGFDPGQQGLRPRHCSHMAGVHPDYRDSGVGFKLKRAQWQMVRQQGIERITWTYDPLQSRNAKFNISKLGAVCNTYLPNYYGELRDGLNVGLPSDRFQVDWWVNSQRALHRLSKQPRPPLDLAHYLSAETPRANSTSINSVGLVTPCLLDVPARESADLLLLEIPSDFMTLKAADAALGLEWRQHTRTLFQGLFAAGYLVTDFIFLRGSQPRSYYVLSHGESTL
jgi:predicted GNAT superfamily acetyltransferase